MKSVKTPSTPHAKSPVARKPSRKEAAQAALERVRALESEISSVIRKMQEKVRQLELITEFSSILNSILDPQAVRERALEATCKLLVCETASLLLVDPKTGELYWETALGEALKEVQKSGRLPINDQSVEGYVAMTGESLIINDTLSAKANRFPKPDLAAHTMLCVPLKRKDKTIGVLQALNKLSSVFQDEDLKLLETLGHQVAIAVDNSRLYTDLKKSFYDTVEALAEAIEKKDSYTGGHTKRVVHYSLCISKYLELSPEQVERIRLGALLHDVGKIGIEDKILKKQTQLDVEEWKIMQTHPEMGHDILGRVEGLKDVMDGMRFHHERWDGNGYPLKLKGQEIPLIARIIAVADTYDAMVSTRPYRKGMDPQVAFDEILKHRGTQFDPAVVDAFVQAFRNEKMGKGSGGSKACLSNCD